MRWPRALSSTIAGACLLLAAGGARPPELRRFAILHFNDFHGQVAPVTGTDDRESGGLARLAGLAESLRARNEESGVPTFVLFAGDAFTGTAFSTLFRGAPEFHVFGMIPLSAAVPGNHEWDFGPAVLAERAAAAPFPFLAANVAARPPPGAIPFKPCTTLRAGRLRVGVIGVTTADTPLTTAPGNTAGYAFSDPVAAVAAQLAAHGPGEWDFVVVLSHCGFEVDRAIARACPRVGLIVGGHDHKVLEKPWVEDGAAIVQAGDRGRLLGDVTVTLGAGPPRVDGRLIAVDRAAPEDHAAAAYLAGYEAREKAELGVVVGHLRQALSGDRQLLRTAEAPIGDLLADAMRQAANADVAFVNAGAIRAGLPEGDVTGSDLYTCLPFFDSLVTVRLQGRQIQALLDRCAAMPTVDPPGGFLQVSGLGVTYAEGHASRVEIAGRPLDPSADYLVACSHFLLAGGDGLEEFAEGRDVRDWGVSLQELMRRQLLRPDVAVPEAGLRIRRAPAP